MKGDEGKKTVESLGWARAIREKYNVPNAQVWCKN